MVSKNLSVCLSVTKFDPNYLRTGRTEWAEIFFWTSMAKTARQADPHPEAEPSITFMTFWQETIALTRPIRRGV